MSTESRQRDQAVGLAYGVAAYGAWGIVPIFWKWLGHVPIWEVGAQRMMWGCAVFMIMVGVRRRGPELRRALLTPRLLARLALSATLLAANWLVFIYAVSTDRVLHASLGYFINPLVSVLLGMVFLQERLSRPQWLAVLLALVGVSLRAADTGGLPWISLALAGSFGMYGLIRKTVDVEGLPGAAAETVLLLPLGISYAAYLQHQGLSHFGGAAADTGLLMATGLVTALPLWWFANAARRLRLATIGFLQYLAPTGQFILAVALFGEPLTSLQLASFGLIWAALAVFSADAWLRHRV